MTTTLNDLVAEDLLKFVDTPAFKNSLGKLLKERKLTFARLATESKDDRQTDRFLGGFAAYDELDTYIEETIEAYLRSQIKKANKVLETKSKEHPYERDIK